MLRALFGGSQANANGAALFWIGKDAWRQGIWYEAFAIHGCLLAPGEWSIAGATADSATATA
ncbi:MAG: hypothetical protein ACI8QS_000569 [Planctomycetota bacterium]|jgi:hypothetical protein